MPKKSKRPKFSLFINLKHMAGSFLYGLLLGKLLQLDAYWPYASLTVGLACGLAGQHNDLISFLRQVRDLKNGSSEEPEGEE